MGCCGGTREEGKGGRGGKGGKGVHGGEDGAGRDLGIGDGD